MFFSCKCQIFVSNSIWCNNCLYLEQNFRRKSINIQRSTTHFIYNYHALVESFALGCIKKFGSDEMQFFMIWFFSANTLKWLQVEQLKVLRPQLVSSRFIGSKHWFPTFESYTILLNWLRKEEIGLIRKRISWFSPPEQQIGYTGWTNRVKVRNMSVDFHPSQTCIYILTFMLYHK